MKVLALETVSVKKLQEEFGQEEGFPKQDDITAQGLDECEFRELSIGLAVKYAKAEQEKKDENASFELIAGNLLKDGNTCVTAAQLQGMSTRRFETVSSLFKLSARYFSSEKKD